MERCIAGKLTDEEAQCFDSALNPTDIVFNHQEGHYQENRLVVSDGFMGVRCRGSGTMAVNELHISRIKNDALNLWKGGVNIQRLYVDHSLPVKYTKQNHPDCVHAYAKRLANDPDTMPPVLDGLYIGYAKFTVKCHGPDDKKNFVIFSEARNKAGQHLINKNIYLFENGVDVELDGDSAGPYLIDSTNFTDSIFGSEDNPIDPERIAGRGIRIGGNKPNLPASRHVVIHAVRGLNIVLNDEIKDSVEIRWQERKIEQSNEGESMMNNPREMSPEGIRTLIDSESSEREVYKCEAGIHTVGVGHALLPHELRSGKIELSNGHVIDLRNGPLSPNEIELLLQDDLLTRRRTIERLVNVDLSQGQFDALVHWQFNTGALSTSTLLKKLNAGNYGAVPDEMRKWNIVTLPSGQRRVSKGLVNRREVEAAMWLAVDSGFDIGDYIKAPHEKEPVYYDHKINSQYPVITDRESKGIEKPIKPIWWSRIFRGGLISGGSVVGVGGLGAAISNKINEVALEAINDPSKAVNGIQEAGVDAAKLIHGVNGLQEWFMWGAVILCFAMAGVIWSLYARLDDRAKGIN